MRKRSVAELNERILLAKKSRENEEYLLKYRNLNNS